jgi:hypothetical protein
MLGYDVLANPDVATWARKPATNRERFFLRPEIRWPLSVDRLTCPSIFQPQFVRAGESALVLTRFPLETSKSPREIRAITGRQVDWEWSELNSFGLWCNFARMRTWHHSRQTTLGKMVRLGIAVRVCFDSEADSDPFWQHVLEEQPQDPFNVDDGDRLGFDVAAPDRSSFLSGYEHTPEEMNDARMKWSAQLNDWGLLRNVESAIAFKEFSNAKMPENAPFYIYDIFRLSLG